MARKSSIPLLLTFMNLCFGVLSIIEIINERYLLSAIFIIIAAVLDRYDGKIARYLHVSSEFGKELDSLADLVSFGVAPALLIFYKYEFTGMGAFKFIGIGLLILFILCGAYRLARYNANDFDGCFRGVPITFAGVVLAIFSCFVPSSNISTIVAAYLLLMFAILMVLKLKLRKM